MAVYNVALSLEVEVSLVAVDLYKRPRLGGGGAGRQSRLLVTRVRPVEIGGGA